MKNKRKSGKRAALWLAALLLILGATMLLRFTSQPVQPAAPQPAAAAPAETPEASPEPPEATPEPEPEPTPEPAPTPEPTPLPTSAPKLRELKYTERTYDLVTDMVVAYRQSGAKGADQIQRDVEKLKAEDAELGRAWEGIMACWDYVNTDLEINTSGELPGDLPQDKSLCIAVLGYELHSDGSMASEMEGRCELALRCADQYPYAYLILCGGGTASKAKDKTEAGVMAEWLREHGVDKERLILEDQSMTTGDNAKNACEILAEQYPQVNTLAIVTSGYHMPVSVLMFTEAALLRSVETGQIPYTVAANLALDVPGTLEFEGRNQQFRYIWVLADPHY